MILKRFMDIQTLQRQGLEENKLRELYLYKIPSLKTCDNWGAVKEIGRIEFKGKHATYNGALVQYGENVYFIPNSRLEALAPYRKWVFKNTITVLKESEVKKK
jgi:hypothetical protein